eukprot:TRINITY_DN10008_c0_g1_i1.p1 TRINITY_DN10008_c0_g1~~TRINITY_DN10008_c0_g1_i1.p1  ORF type:complete len:390 (+),score=73.08 TRINITY_DN10008_c0_g1_i1:23-1171(+)
MAASPFTVLVLGGYGFFGRRLVERLGSNDQLKVLVVGRSMVKAQGLSDKLQPKSKAKLVPLKMDLYSPTFLTELSMISPDCVVHTAGPFQGQGYDVAEACIAAGVNYVDIADGREFVSNICKLDSAAKEKGVLVVSGASSVPALSSAVVDEAINRGKLSRVDNIDIGINPGNKTERGIATVKAILSFNGHPIPSHPPTNGWDGVITREYPAPVGGRLLSPCDVPDVALFPELYSQRSSTGELHKPTVHFRAGLELKFLHYAMMAMSYITRKTGIVRDWSSHGWWLIELSKFFMIFGTHDGAMHVEVTGSSGVEPSKKLTWTLLAKDGDGPNTPVLAAAAIVNRLQRGALPSTGAMPCLGLVSAEECINETTGLAIDTMWEEE